MNIMVLNEKWECFGCDCFVICVVYFIIIIIFIVNFFFGVVYCEILIMVNGDNIYSVFVGIYWKGRVIRKNLGNDCFDCDLDSCGCGCGINGVCFVGMLG